MSKKSPIAQALPPRRHIRPPIRLICLSALIGWNGLGHLAHAAEPGYACLIEPYQRVELRSAIEARIDTIHVHRGAEVRKGQILVELDAASERIALEGARYRAVMEGQVRSAESRLTAAKEKLRRREELVQERFMAPQDRDDTLADMQMAEANLVEAKDNRRLADIEQRRLAEALEQRRIRSPINGVVTDRLQQPGEIAQAGENARPILKLAQINPLRVEVVLPVAMFGKVRNGSKAVVEAERPLSGRYNAVVTVVDKVVDSASGTFGVRLEIANPDGSIPAGIKCRTTFQ
ncbi:MAG: efflux RND transporter periplasmic adaptor subunit [Aquabacterium sp.]